WLEDASYFAAVDDTIDSFSWYQWPSPLKDRHLVALAQIYESRREYVCTGFLSTFILRPSDRLDVALNLLLQAKVSSIPIVDGNSSLLGVYSHSDITALVKDSVYVHINVEEFTIGQALQFGNDAYNSRESSRYQVCLRTDPLFKVMELLAKPGVRRLVIVEQSSRRIEGIISLSDIFNFFMG
ncbi:hypothetical protein V2J09_016249, partial [Rumex salicifolius]